MNKKNVIFIMIACLIVLTASFGITYAYLISSDSEINEFVVGENTIKVVEEFDPPEKLEPGTKFVKKPQVQNTGNLPCFVRMRADFSDSTAKEFCKPLDISDKWEFHEDDGYYYYKELLLPGDTTTALFEQVEIKTETEGVSPSDMIDFDILIYAESCQYNDHEGNCAEKEYYQIWKR